MNLSSISPNSQSASKFHVSFDYAYLNLMVLFIPSFFANAPLDGSRLTSACMALLVPRFDA